jgi:anti-sigma B factor antagonist
VVIISKLRIDTEHLEEGVLLSVAGEIDMASAPELTVSLARLDPKDGSVTVDLDAVTFMDCAGLHALSTFASSMNGNGPVRVLNASPTVVRIMKIVGMTDVPQIQLDRVDEQRG